MTRRQFTVLTSKRIFRPPGYEINLEANTGVVNYTTTSDGLQQYRVLAIGDPTSPATAFGITLPQ